MESNVDKIETLAKALNQACDEKTTRVFHKRKNEDKKQKWDRTAYAWRAAIWQMKKIPFFIFKLHWKLVGAILVIAILIISIIAVTSHYEFSFADILILGILCLIALLLIALIPWLIYRGAGQYITISYKDSQGSNCGQGDASEFAISLKYSESNSINIDGFTARRMGTKASSKLPDLLVLLVDKNKEGKTVITYHSDPKMQETYYHVFSQAFGVVPKLIGNKDCFKGPEYSCDVNHPLASIN
jgi:hypothetical protein